MIPRLICVLVLISLVSGTVWYAFRDTPQKKIQRWREVSEALYTEKGDLDRAEELNSKILELVPHSVYDLVFKARINERKGIPGSRVSVSTRRGSCVAWVATGMRKP
jgi:hypothetical protein